PFGAVRMKYLCTILVTTVMVLSAVQTGTARSQAVTVPALVRLDGELKTDTGQPRTGTLTLVLSVYADQRDSNALWLEQQSVTLDAAGHFVVFVGATLPTGIPKELFTAQAARWFGVGVL